MSGFNGVSGKPNTQDQIDKSNPTTNNIETDALESSGQIKDILDLSSEQESVIPSCEDLNATQTEINNKSTDLQTAMNNLKIIADLSIINIRINEAQNFDENDYTPLTWSYLETALNSAITVRDDSNSSQTDLNNAATALQTAIDNLISTVALSTKINEAQNLDENDHTPATWTDLEAALFEVKSINLNYIVKGNLVFWLEEEVIGADTQTFEALSETHPRYARDKNFVYNSGKVIEGADPETFHFIKNENDVESSFATDNTGMIYVGGRKLDVDIDTFKVISYNESYDKFGIYIGDRKGTSKEVQYIRKNNSIPITSFEMMINSFIRELGKLRKLKK